MHLRIRKYHKTDLSYIYKICLGTANNGGDATTIIDDPYLPGHIFAAPYVIFEPNLCFVLLKDSIPYGYILGTQNSLDFQEKCDVKWFPELRKRYGIPDSNDESLQANLIRYLYEKKKVAKGLDKYPAHLHIDILQIVQGIGYGRKLLELFLNQLRALNVQGVHLIVSNSNQNAIGFYKKVGLKILKTLEESTVFVKRLQSFH